MEDRLESLTLKEWLLVGVVVASFSYGIACYVNDNSSFNYNNQNNQPSQVSVYR